MFGLLFIVIYLDFYISISTGSMGKRKGVTQLSLSFSFSAGRDQNLPHGSFKN